LRLALFREHLDRADDDGLGDPARAFAEFARSAARLQAWHDGGRHGTRPPGRLRPYPVPPLSPVTRWWSARAYRHLYDPDGRPAALRRAGAF
jgi:hypothetical protein